MHTLTNKQGLKASITNFGGRLVNLLVPDRSGKMINIVSGFNDLDDLIIVPTPSFKLKKEKAGKSNTKNQPVNKNENNVDLLTINSFEDENDQQELLWNANQTNNTLDISYFTKISGVGNAVYRKVKLQYILTDNNSLKITCETSTDHLHAVNIAQRIFFQSEWNG